MKLPASPYRSLYLRITRLRGVLACVLIAIVVVTEMVQSIRHHPGYSSEELSLDLLVYGLIGPALIWFAMTWLGGWLRQRDEAEARLHVLYEISREVADAADLEAVDEIALSTPSRVLGAVGTALIAQEVSNGPWTLVGTRNLSDNQREAIEALVQDPATRLPCEQCHALSAALDSPCPMLLSVLQDTPKAAPIATLCLPLSRDVPPHALLNVFVARDLDRPAEEPQMLESLAAGLALARDRARLRGRDMRVLQGVEQVVRTPETWATAVEEMLAGIALAYDAVRGAVFLAPNDPNCTSLTLAASWPSDEAALPLALGAQEAFAAKKPEIVEAPTEIGHVTVVPLVSEGQPVGVVALAGEAACAPSQLAFLRVAATVMAVVIRNGQLYAELESQAVLEERQRLAREMHDGLAQYLSFLNFKVQQVGRLLGREPEAARLALQEVRAGINDLYAEVRVAIQDLRSPGLHERDLAEQIQEFVSAFAVRSGLDISFSSDGPADVSPQAKVHLLRVVEEALTNVHRHAQARRCWVRLQAGPEAATLEVKDDGIGLADGMTPHSPVSFGLRIMQERVQAVGGHFRLESRPGEGVLLQVTVPMRPQFQTVGGG